MSGAPTTVGGPDPVERLRRLTRHPMAMSSGKESGANGMTTGDVVMYMDGRLCRCDEFLQDGDAFVVFESERGTPIFDTVKWNNLRPNLPPPTNPPSHVPERGFVNDGFGKGKRLEAARRSAVEDAQGWQPPGWFPTHRHYKGGLYRELLRARLESEPGVQMVVYESQTGERWTRPAAEFDSVVSDENHAIARFRRL